MLRRSDIFEPATPLEKAFNSPVKTLISLLYHTSTRAKGLVSSPLNAISVVCISDTHCKITDEIPDGDVLIHAGDLTNAGNTTELQAQIDWLDEFPHRYKIAIAGNHDTFLDGKSRATLQQQEQQSSLDWKSIRYLQHDSVTLDFPSSASTTTSRSLKVYGAPQIPQCGGADFAFQYVRGQDTWSNTVPKDIDILVTHTPPKFHLDNHLPSLGCEHLLQETWRVKPLVHVFGHVHVGAGRETVHWDEAQKAYERALARSTNGLLSELFNPWLWIDLIEVIVYGIIDVVRSRLPGPEVRRSIFVNAALTYNNTGKLGRTPQVIEI